MLKQQEYLGILINNSNNQIRLYNKHNSNKQINKINLIIKMVQIIILTIIIIQIQPIFKKK
jgi:hypothetical protein